MKNPSLRTTGAAHDDEDGLRADAPLSFKVTHVCPVSYGSKKLEFEAELPAIGRFQFDLFAPENRAPFVVPRSVRSKVTGEWTRTFSLDRSFAMRLLEAVASEIERRSDRQVPESAEPKKRRSEPQQECEPNEVLLQSERRFEAALDALGEIRA